METNFGKKDLTAALIAGAEVQAFDCGETPWAVFINTWLKAPRGHDGLLDELELNNGVAFAYTDGAGQLVGVGAVGPRTVSWPGAAGEKIDTLCITGLGVDRRHAGRGYGNKILSDLLNLAQCVADAAPLVMLDVDVENTDAQSWYVKKGFKAFGAVYEYRGRHYQQMYLDVRPATG